MKMLIFLTSPKSELLEPLKSSFTFYIRFVDSLPGQALLVVHRWNNTLVQILVAGNISVAIV